MSAFYIVTCSALPIPAVVAGALVTDLGLETTFEAFGSAVAAIAIAVAFAAWRTRPGVRLVRDAQARFQSATQCDRGARLASAFLAGGSWFCKRKRAAFRPDGTGSAP
jgi:hypothetical protein